MSALDNEAVPGFAKGKNLNSFLDRLHQNKWIISVVFFWKSWNMYQQEIFDFHDVFVSTNCLDLHKSLRPDTLPPVAYL